MADDYAGNASTTGVITPGASVSGNLETNADSDWFAINLQAGLLYEFDVSEASNFQHVNGIDLGLVNSAGVQVAGLGGTDKTIQYVPATSGAYFVTVNSINFNGYGLGGYTLTATPSDEFTGNTSTVGQLSIGGSLSASLAPHGDIDWIRINLTKGFNYQFSVAGAADFTNVSSLTLQLLDSNGVAVPDISTIKTETYTAAASGAYYLQVSANSVDGTGDYTLTSIADDFSADSSTTGRLAPGSSASGTIEALGDHDWFAVSLVAGGVYRFGLSALANLSPASSASIILRNGSGSPLSSSGTTSTPVIYTPTATGTYYLDVSAASTTGSYQVSATTVSLPPAATTAGTSPGNSTPSTATSTPVYRFFDSNFGTHFYTSSASERATILATRPDLVDEGVGLDALMQSSDPNVSAVYRFFDTIHGTQFLTSAATERDAIIATRADLHFEGTAFYEYNSQVAGSAPVYRFFDSIYGTHFYTGSDSERATILATRSDLVPEGVAFYAPTS